MHLLVKNNQSFLIKTIKEIQTLILKDAIINIYSPRNNFKSNIYVCILYIYIYIYIYTNVYKIYWEERKNDSEVTEHFLFHVLSILYFIF